MKYTGYEPKSVAEMRKATFKIRVHKKKPFLQEHSCEYCIILKEGYEALFVEEVDARFIKWLWPEYYIEFSYNGEEYDIWYPINLDHLVYDDKLIFKIKIEEGNENS